MYIKLRNVRVDLADDLKREVILEIESTPLTKEQTNVLDQLFPDLEKAVVKLLAKQALLNLIDQ